jgi:hypothetical protein
MHAGKKKMTSTATLKGAPETKRQVAHVTATELALFEEGFADARDTRVNVQRKPNLLHCFGVQESPRAPKGKT